MCRRKKEDKEYGNDACLFHEGATINMEDDGFLIGDLRDNIKELSRRKDSLSNAQDGEWIAVFFDTRT